MKSREDRDAAFLDDIRQACATIAARCQSRNLTDLAENSEFRDGLVLQLIVVGEAAKNLTEAARKRHPGAPWREMIRLRDLFIHHYWTIDALKLWQIVTVDVPELQDILSREA